MLSAKIKPNKLNEKANKAKLRYRSGLWFREKSKNNENINPWIAPKIIKIWAKVNTTFILKFENRYYKCMNFL